jgi:hypothetical protein
MATRYYSSTAAETTLSGTINSSATSITVGSVTGFPVSFPYTLALDYESASEELVDVTAAAGTNLTITRAADGTSATSVTYPLPETFASLVSTRRTRQEFTE